MEPKTPVIFRKDSKSGVIVAFFPNLPGTNDYLTCACYEHIGQHGLAHWEYYMTTKRATEEEYKDLKVELENMYDYELEVYKNWIQKFDRVRREELFR